MEVPIYALAVAGGRADNNQEDFNVTTSNPLFSPAHGNREPQALVRPSTARPTTNGSPLQMLRPIPVAAKDVGTVMLSRGLQEPLPSWPPRSSVTVLSKGVNPGFHVYSTHSLPLRHVDYIPGSVHVLSNQACIVVISSFHFTVNWLWVPSDTYNDTIIP